MRSENEVKIKTTLNTDHQFRPIFHVAHVGKLIVDVKLQRQQLRLPFLQFKFRVGCGSGECLPLRDLDEKYMKQRSADLISKKVRARKTTRCCVTMLEHAGLQRTACPSVLRNSSYSSPFCDCSADEEHLSVTVRLRAASCTLNTS